MSQSSKIALILGSNPGCLSSMLGFRRYCASFLSMICQTSLESAHCKEGKGDMLRQAGAENVKGRLLRTELEGSESEGSWAEGVMLFLWGDMVIGEPPGRDVEQEAEGADGIGTHSSC